MTDQERPTCAICGETLTDSGKGYTTCRNRIPSTVEDEPLDLLVACHSCAVRRDYEQPVCCGNTSKACSVEGPCSVWQERHRDSVQVDVRETLVVCPRVQCQGAYRRLIAERETMRSILSIVSGQLADFKDPYLDPDGNDCRTAVAHLIASDIEKYLGGTHD